ncbi:MAG TPA: putative Ig domain-containing protein [Acidobacteriaceae bacterium]
MRSFVSVMLAVLVVAVVGCGGSGTQGGTVTLSPSTVPTLDAGQSVAFVATVAGDSSNAGVHWQVQGPGVLSNQTTTSVTYTAPGSINTAMTTAVEAIPNANNLASATTLINLFPGLSITTTSAPAATINAAYSYQMASTGGSGTVTWGLVSGTPPPGITITSKGLISGSPSQYGSYSFVISAKDSATTPMTVTQLLTIAVNAVTLAVSTASVPNNVVGAAYSATLAQTGGIAPYTWNSISGTLPPGITLSAGGVLSGSATTAGAYTFTVQVTDTEAVPQTAQKAFTINVYNKLSIITTSLPNGAQNTAYSQTLSAIGGSGTLKWQSSGTLPAGLTLTSAGVFAGTPTTATTASFTVQVTDASVPQQVATQSLSLTIVAPLSIVTASLPAATVNNFYNVALASSGGNAPVTWSLASGSLPQGLQLSSIGVVSGTPLQTGTSNFVVQGVDTTPSTVTQSLSLIVNALAPLVISTASLPDGNIGVSYSRTLAATGGAVPYTWSLATGTLPTGFTLSSNGTLSGTPKAPGAFTFGVKVADGEATPATATQSYTVTIGNAGANAALTGNYAFLLHGFAAGHTAATAYGFAAIGSLHMDGAGNVTGIEDLNSTTGVQQSLPVTGTYTFGTDGRGTLSLSANSTTSAYAIAAGNVANGVMQSIMLNEWDNSSGTGAQSVGMAKLQTAPALAASALTGTFAFGMEGESCTGCTASAFGPVAMVGLIHGDGVSALSAGQEDAAQYGQNISGTTLSGSFSPPSSSTGRGTLTLSATGSTIAAAPSDFTYVIVNANEFLLMSNISHATSALLYGDALLQQQSTYAAATEFSGRSIGYESQASGGDGSTLYPTSLNATLYQLANTGSGTAAFFEDTNQAGTLTTSTSATAVTYTTSSSGRVVLSTNGASNQVIYLYNVGAGLGLDMATASTYPALVHYEQQVKLSASLPALPMGTFAAGTLDIPVRTDTLSGAYVYSPDSGGGDVGFINGTAGKTLDGSTAGGTLTAYQKSSTNTAEDLTGRQIETATPTGTTPMAITYAITSTRSVSIPATGATPTVLLLQQ